jgi:nucleoside-diphosphate-sugar epimerase
MSKKNIKVIEGSGFLAKKFRKYSPFLKRHNVIIYAAGVSNSLEKNSKKFEKELLRFKNFCNINNKKLVYISTYSIFDKSRNKNKYIKNKLKIENIIKKKISEYIIVRFPEVVGFSKNPNTLTNYFFKNIKNKKKFIVFKNVKRNVIDVDDAIKICLYFIKTYKEKNKVINILNKKFYQPIKILKLFEIILKTNSNYSVVKKKRENWKIVNSLNSKIEKKLKIKFNDQYLIKTLKKYYQ